MTDRELDSHHSSVVPQGASGTTDDSTHDIEPRNTEDFSRSLGLVVSPLECDIRASIGAAAVPDITATAPSSHAYMQSRRR